MSMSRKTVPMGLIDANGIRLPTNPLYWQYKGNKGGETYLKYIAYSRIGTLASEAGWLIIENEQDSSGNLISRKVARTGSNAIPLFDQVFDSSSALTISAITKAANAEVTTSTPHGLSTNDQIEITASDMSEVVSDGSGSIVFTITKVDATKFTLGVNSSAYVAVGTSGTLYARTLFGLDYA